MIKTFYHFQGRRSIAIHIEQGFISFRFPEEGDREFYYIPADDWDNTWPQHMGRKSWYTEAMTDFINENLPSHA